MDLAVSLPGWLAELDQAALAEVLGNRADALLPEPRSIAELAERLDRPESLVAALRVLPLPCVQVVEAMTVLGGATSTAELAALLEGDSAEHETLVAHWLQVLTVHAIVRPAGDGMVGTPAAVDEIFPSPLRLGPSLRSVLAAAPLDGMRRVLQTLGMPKPPARRDDVLAGLRRVLADPETVRGIVATAPSAVAQELRAWARAGERSEADSYVSSYDSATQQRRAAAAKWALDRGLVFGQQWSYGWQMPAEVSRALRGPGYRARFAASPPDVDLATIDGAQLGSHSAAAVSRFGQLLLSLVDRLARIPLPALKSGGVGARELAKLGKAIGGDEGEVRLALELCAAAGVLDNDGTGWRLSGDAEQWRSLPQPDRVGGILTVWWELPSAPSEARDEDGKVVPALKSRSCEGCLLARQNLLQTLAELEEGVAAEPRQLADRALWRQPFVHVLAQDEQEPFASTTAEATVLGLVAAGALTPLGRALVAGDPVTMRDLLTAALPASNDHALFGADLTAVVAGAPSAEVSRLLDAAADRESRGGATVWRFTPGSIRRALDEGQDAAGLEQALVGVATGELPQPLRYLIGDVGRRHGNLRVAAAVSLVRSDDEALLKQVAADRALRKLGLRMLAPTVLGADAETSIVLTALRSAGYLPMPDGDAGAAAAVLPAAAPAGARSNVVAAARRRVERRTRGAEPAEVAARLLAGPADVVELVGPSEARLRAASGSLTTGEIRMLADAVDNDGAVAISYQSQSGNVTRRVISGPELDGESILAWCELRSDERWFRIDRIQSVFPAG